MRTNDIKEMLSIDPKNPINKPITLPYDIINITIFYAEGGLHEFEF